MLTMYLKRDIPLHFSLYFRKPSAIPQLGLSYETYTCTRGEPIP